MRPQTEDEVLRRKPVQSLVNAALAPVDRRFPIGMRKIRVGQALRRPA
jgi:hypothetical protein